MVKLKYQLLFSTAALLISSGVAAQELIVSAAASLSNAFTEIGVEFEKENPNVKVTFNFAASGVLLRQIEQGAPVDVFASADQATMDRAEKAGLINQQTRFNFVENKLVLIVPKGATKPQTIGELKKEMYRTIALGTPSSVPAGSYAQQYLNKEGLWAVLEPKMVFGESVRQVLQYVSAKEADAGFVYSTDAAVSAKSVEVALVIPTLNPITYPIAQVKASESQELAQKFVQFMQSHYAQQIFATYGFSTPTK